MLLKISDSRVLDIGPFGKHMDRVLDAEAAAGRLPTTWLKVAGRWKYVRPDPDPAVAQARARVALLDLLATDVHEGA